MGIEQIVNKLQSALDEANRQIKNRDQYLAHTFFGDARRHLKQYAHVIFSTNEDIFRMLIGYYYHTKARYERLVKNEDAEDA